MKKFFYALEEWINADDCPALYSVARMFLVGGVAVTIFVTLLVIVVGLLFPSSGHGSCKYEHWGAKTYVCDEFYPVPTVEP